MFHPGPSTRSAATINVRDGRYHGWPTALQIQIEYSLGDQGLAVRTTATNVGDQPCPYGARQHPYGDGLVVLEPGATHSSRWGISPG